MSMCGEIENTQNEIQNVKSAVFDLSYMSDHLSEVERAIKIEDVREQLITATQHLNSLLEAVNSLEDARHG